MNKNFALASSDLDTITLRTITEADCENLRQWKNANRTAFFYQEIITPEQQERWFRDYLQREDDLMFMVLADGKAIGCMGFRMLGDQADVYNVILGIPEMGKQGLMRDALRLMCSYTMANFTRDIGVKVLRSNLAIGWYERNGFRASVAHDTFVEFRLDPAQFQPCRFQITP